MKVSRAWNLKSQVQATLLGMAALAVTVLGGCTSKSQQGSAGSGTAATTAATAPVRELHIFIWSDYISDDFIKQFEKENHAKVVLDFFSSNEEMLAKVQATVQSNSRGYDLVSPSDYMSGNMIKLGLLQPLDHSKLTFLTEYGKEFQNPTYDPGLTHVVPFSWGTSGLAVQTKLFSKFAPGLDLSKGLSWKTLFEDARFSKQVTLLDDAKEVLHVALLIQGKKWATATEADVRSAFTYLKAHKQNVRLFTSEPKPVMLNEECALCQTFSGDALKVMKETADVKYVIPEEGATLWTDNLAIPKNAADPALALLFMNKFLEKQAARNFTENTFFPSPNAEAMKLLDPKLTSNLSIFPAPKTFSKLSYLVERPQLLLVIDQLWTEFKSQ
ncbi:MAG: spermidine/putrescine ABC transporter substrate-binding protein [Methylotenera sp.]|nr:spermidine/putrescine ABC transporter substrate-binding protein [Oligoflexia bacterium]